MSTLVLKGLPDTLHKMLRLRAKEHRRSVTQEAIGILEKILLPHQISFSDKPLKLKKPLTVEEIQEAIDWGRR